MPAGRGYVSFQEAYLKKDNAVIPTFETKIFFEKTAATTGFQSMTNCSVVNLSSFHCLTLSVFDALGFPLGSIRPLWPIF